MPGGSENFMANANGRIGAQWRYGETDDPGQYV